MPVNSLRLEATSGPERWRSPVSQSSIAHRCGPEVSGQHPWLRLSLLATGARVALAAGM